MTFVTLTMGRPCCFLEVQEENVEEIAAFCVIHVFYCVTCANSSSIVVGGTRTFFWKCSRNSQLLYYCLCDGSHFVKTICFFIFYENYMFLPLMKTIWLYVFCVFCARFRVMIFPLRDILGKAGSRWCNALGISLWMSHQVAIVFKSRDGKLLSR